MFNSLSTGILPPETLALIDSVLADKVQNSECFFAIDVSNEVKTLGIKANTPTGFGKHTDMQKVIFDRMVTFMAAGAYGCTDFPFNSALDIPGRRLYHPLTESQAVIDAHENRKVVALPPVEVLMAQKSTQASGVQSMVSSIGAAAPVTSTPTAAIPAIVPDAPSTLGGHILKQLGNGAQ